MTANVLATWPLPTAVAARLANSRSAAVIITADLTPAQDQLLADLITAFLPAVQRVTS